MTLSNAELLMAYCMLPCHTAHGYVKPTRFVYITARIVQKRDGIHTHQHVYHILFGLFSTRRLAFRAGCGRGPRVAQPDSVFGLTVILINDCDCCGLALWT